MARLCAIAAAAAFASTSLAASAPDGQGKNAAPFPNSYYPGYEDPLTDAGAKFGQTSPPSYPSPWQNATGDWAVAFAKAQALVRQMTLAEKVNITTGVGWQSERCVGQTGGVPRLGFRSMCMQDSPLGVRFKDYASVFPGGATIAATWDRSLFYQRGYDMGSEHRDSGVDVQLGPVVGPLGRAPEGGRNWEGFSPDPVLSGIAVGETVQGIQAAGVIACTKHLIGNEQEHFRQANNDGLQYSEAISSNIDDITMHELYLWPFADAIRAGTGSIMCSYNQLNNSYACQNSYLLNYLVKNELNFQGFIMSDWGAQLAGVGTALAGMDMAMPGDTAFNSGLAYWGTNLTVAVLNGTVPMWRLNDMATRIISAWYYVGRDTTQVPINFDSWTLATNGYEHYYAKEGYELVNEHIDVQGTHAQDIRAMAAAGTVLLKNTNNALPLNAANDRFTALFGSDCGPNPQGPNGCGDRGCDQGTLGIGWGSGTANYPYLITPLEAISNQVQTYGNGIVQGITDDFAYDQIAALAQQATVCIAFANADSGEGYITVSGNIGDRNNLTLWNQGDKLIQTVASNCNNTIVVIHAPGPVLMTQWYDNENVTAILYAGMPGQESGNSLVDVLYGNVNPGAKLPFTLGARRQDYGTDLLYKLNNGKNAPQQQFAEGVFIDYRAFDKHNTTPIYEFGFGLSYTTFSYANLQVQAATQTPYIPNKGMTGPAPKFGSPGVPADSLYPGALKRIGAYIYPYLNSTNLKASSGDPAFGQPASSYIPSKARAGAPQPLLPAGGAPGGNPGLYDVFFSVSSVITNTGSVQGDEVPQLYLNLGGPNDPKVVLRQFDRITIPVGESVTWTANITRRDLSNWDPASQNWVISKYPKTVYVGSSSRNLPLKATLPTIKV